MIVKFTILAFVGFILSGPLCAQIPPPCTGLGQTPSSAFPVCGTDKFIQANVPVCGVNTIPVPGCNDNMNVLYQDKNPYWYKFTCYTAGTLGFLIKPNDLGDDYDWQLFDITGRDPSEVFTNPSLFVVGNWSGSYGLTGSSAGGTGSVQCASDPRDAVPTFSKWPTLIKGHNYLLVISHFTGDAQSGYALSFGGGTASITDTVQPHMKSVSVSCDATQLTVTFNKKLKCSSLASGGSDFITGSGPAAALVSATGFNCNNGFDMDSVLLTFDKALSPGNYTLVAQKGIDGNTLLDNCGTPLPEADQLAFAVAPLLPTPLDSISPVGCSPDIIRLVFQKRIRCSSIAADGSDFRITGPTPVTILGATGNCSNGLSSTIDIRLSAPIYLQGNYQLSLVTGTDLNPIIDECGQETPAGSTKDFATADTVSAQFSYQVLWGCTYDTITVANNGGASINQWQWNFDSAASSNLRSPLLIYSVFGDKQVQCIVSNGVCSDTASTVVSLNNTLVANFEAPDLLCPADKASFINNSIGRIVDWKWDFGDGSTDFNRTPLAHAYPNNPLADQFFQVNLIVLDDIGCRDTVTRQIRKLHSCYIAVPGAFTPNGDGLNDYLYPLNAFKATDLLFRVYNRYGQLVFETRDWSRRWDGKLGGKPQGTGTYVWTLQYTDSETGKKVSQKGTSVLIR